MQVQTTPLTVLHYGTWSDADATGDDRIAWRSGQLVEFVKVLDAETGNIRDITLDESVNGSRAELGAQVRLVCNLETEEKVAYSRGGREYVAKKDKWRVLDMQAA